MMRERRGVRHGGIRAAFGAAAAISLVALGAVNAQASENPVFDSGWALGSSAFNVTRIWSQYQAGDFGVTVAVVDSGVDSSRPDLQGAPLPGRNLVDPGSPTADTGDKSTDYHGTDVAPVIAAPAQTGNSLGGSAAGSGGSGAGSASSTAADAQDSSNGTSSIVAYIGIGAGILVLIGLIVFFIGRGKKDGRGGGGGGGGGGDLFSPRQPGPGGMQEAPMPGRQPPMTYPGSTPPPPPQYSGAASGRPSDQSSSQR